MKTDLRKPNRTWKEIVALLAAAALLLAGCGDAVPDFVEPIPQQETTQETETTEQPAGTTEQEEESTEQADSYLVPYLKTPGYGYEQLSDAGQVLYRQMMESFVTRQEVTVSTLNQNDLGPVFSAVIADHPELFYLTGYVWNSYMANGVVTRLTVSGNFSVNKETQEADQSQVDAVVEAFASSLSPDLSDFEKVRAAYDYVVQHTDYDTSAPDNQNILSVFLNGASVCNGYAKAMQYLCLRLGIPCTLVTGEANGDGHAWDLVYAGGDYYYADPTFGDGSFTGIEMQDNWVDYDYLMITTDDLAPTHQADSSIALPECTATALNYYVYEGLCLTDWDGAQVESMIAGELSDGSGVIRLRAADDDIYNSMVEHLIDRQEIYSYLGGVNAIQYSTNADLNTMVVFLKEG